MAPRASLALSLLVAALALPGPAAAMGDSGVAALQVALRARGVYAGTVDGVYGRATTAAVRRFQRRAGLVVDGIAGPRTRRALGRRGRPSLGARVLRRGRVGWDVAQLQFLLAWHGFPSGTMDGVFGSRTRRAVRRFQRWSRLRVDGVAGPATIGALRTAPPRSPVAVRWPLRSRLGDGFGPRGARFHTGLDFPAAHGTGVVAARSGRVSFAGWSSGGFGYVVAIAHGRGVRTKYAHLSTVSVRLRQRVRSGRRIGRVGSTGSSSGPHLHFEVSVRGAAVDPLSALR